MHDGKIMFKSLWLPSVRSSPCLQPRSCWCPQPRSSLCYSILDLLRFRPYLYVPAQREGVFPQGPLPLSALWHFSRAGLGRRQTALALANEKYLDFSRETGKIKICGRTTLIFLQSWFFKIQHRLLFRLEKSRCHLDFSAKNQDAHLDFSAKIQDEHLDFLQKSRSWFLPKNQHVDFCDNRDLDFSCKSWFFAKIKMHLDFSVKSR